MRTVLPFKTVFLIVILQSVLIPMRAEIANELVVSNPVLANRMAGQDGADYEGQRLNSVRFESFNDADSSLLASTAFDFTTSNEQNAVVLKWSAPQQQTVSMFIVERSTDAVNFTQSGTVSANTASSNYVYTDQVSLTYSKTYYRIKLVESNDRLSYSTVKIVNTKREVGVRVISCPKPAKVQLYLSMPEVWIDKKATIYLYNNAGMLVKITEIQKLSATETMNIASLTRGTYLVNIRCDDAQMKSLIRKN